MSVKSYEEMNAEQRFAYAAGRRAASMEWPDSVVLTRVIGAVSSAARKAPNRRERRRLERLASDLATIANVISAARFKEEETKP